MSLRAFLNQKFRFAGKVRPPGINPVQILQPTTELWSASHNLKERQWIFRSEGGGNAADHPGPAQLGKHAQYG